MTRSGPGPVRGVGVGVDVAVGVAVAVGSKGLTVGVGVGLSVGGKVAGGAAGSTRRYSEEPQMSIKYTSPSWSSPKELTSYCVPANWVRTHGPPASRRRDHSRPVQ